MHLLPLQLMSHCSFLWLTVAVCECRYSWKRSYFVDLIGLACHCTVTVFQTTMLAKLEMLTHFSCLLLETMQVTGKQATKNGTGKSILLLEDSMLSSRFWLRFIWKHFQEYYCKPKNLLEVCKQKVTTSVTVLKSEMISEFLNRKAQQFWKDLVRKWELYTEG